MLEGIIICLALLVVQLVVLYFVDKRLDYAQMNDSYAAAAGTQVAHAEIGSAVKKRKRAAAKPLPEDELP
ncbi:hypothetical protein [Halotalea alkalilenta]|uniref:hypothetical protein n=1 Tax=Halotalea alkalilenta TaxID=376489 RepID=UPI0004862814|nr:hypothetical protein [Halotalea alkalilenta]